MRKKGLFLVILSIAALLVLRGFHFFQPSSFCLPIQLMNPYQIPCTTIEIEGKIYQVEIDLGTKMALSLHKDILQKIKKELCGTSRRLDFLGNRYETPLYLIPNVRVGNRRLKRVKTREESGDFCAKTSIVVEAKTDVQKDGRLGRDFFVDKNIFMDFHNLVFVVCEKISDLKQYKIDDFLPVPFKVTSSGIFVDIDTDIGVQRFAIDTGSTASAIRASSMANDRAVQREGLSVFETSKFIVNGVDLGHRDLYLLDISQQLDELDGFLGMDFLKEYALYLDFSKQVAYISKSR